MQLSNLQNIQLATLNSGNKGTPVEPGVFTGWYAHFADQSLTQAQMDNLLNTLQTKVYDNNRNLRFYKLGTFGEAEDQSADATQRSMGYGIATYTKDGRPQFMFYPQSADESLHKIMRKYNRRASGLRIMFWDENNLLFCASFKTATGEVRYRGFSLADLYAPNIQLNTSEGIKHGIYVALASTAEWNNRAFKQCDFGLEDVGTVNDVEISVANALASNVIDLYLTTNNTQDNFVDLFGTTLIAGSGALFNVYREANGAPVNITAASVQVVNGRNVIRLTFSTTTNPLPASGQAIYIDLDPVQDLLTAGIEGYEGLRLRVVVP